MFGRIMTRRLDCLLKNANLIIMAWKTSDFLVLNEPWLTVLLTKVINIIDMKKKWLLHGLRTPNKVFFLFLYNDYGP